MPRISVVIITYNEERNIERCLQSVQGVADEILVVDSYSTDRTEEICKRYHVRFVRHFFEGYIEQKNWATLQARYDHVLFLDADEALSDALRQSIMQVKTNWTHDGYTFNRLTNYCGHWIRHTSWYPSRKLRLYDRRKGQWDGINPHDQFVMSEESAIRHLQGDLLHYSYYTIEQHLQQINNFTEIIAGSYYQKGLCPTFLWHVVFHPLWRFFRDYFIKLGFLDGFYGFVISVNGAYEVYLKYLKIYHRIRTERRQSPFRLCFYWASDEWNVAAESLFAYMVGLQQKGVELSLVAPSGSSILKKAKSARMNYFPITSSGNKIIPAFFSAWRFISYLKSYRVAAIVADEADKISFITRCARWAEVPHIIIQRTDYIGTVPANSVKHYYRYQVNGTIIDSDIKFYTYLINHYEWITHQKTDNQSASAIVNNTTMADYISVNNNEEI